VRLLLEIASSDKAIGLLIPTPNSRSSLSSKFSFVLGSSDLPRCCKNPNRVSVEAWIASSFTIPYFLRTSISGEDLEHFDSHYIDTTNEANNKPVYYYTHKKNLGTDNFTDAGQVILISCNDSLISDLDVSNASVGIEHVMGYNVTIYNNSASNGIFGISITGSHENNITDNRANYNKECGIFLLSSNNNNITQNTANNNGWGIYLWSSNYTLVSGNTLLGNTICNDQIGCVNNTLINNNCGVAIAVGDGDDDDDDKKEEVIPGYDLFILVGMILLLGVIYIIIVKKRLKV